MTVRKPIKKIHYHQKKASGFTLVEMAVVVTIMGLMMAMGLSMANSMLQNTQRSVTKEKLSFVKDATVAYFLSNKRMPCPDTGSNVGNTGRDGLENRLLGGVNPNTNSGCTSNMGTVPYLTLGISRSQALDAYGNFITYRLDTLRNWHLSTTFIPPPPGCLINGINAGIPPIPAGAVAVNTALATVENPTVALVLISHGSNGLGAWNTGTNNASRNALPATPDELGNSQQVPAAPAAYRNYVFSDLVANPFDDLLQFVSFGDINTIATKVGRANICS